MKTGDVRELVKGIYAVKTIWMARTSILPTYSFILQGSAGGEITLFDTGGPGSGELILEGVRKIGASPEMITGIALSHWHMDHTGGLAEVVENIPGETEVFIHSLDRQLFESGRRRILKMHPLLRLPVIHRPGKTPAPGSCRFMDADREQDALARRGLTAVHTPGHTPGHTSYFHGQSGALFSGCGLSLTGRNTAGLVPVFDDRHSQLRSGRMIAEMDFKYLFAVHMHLNTGKIEKSSRAAAEGRRALADRLTGTVPLFRYPRQSS